MLTISKSPKQIALAGEKLIFEVETNNEFTPGTKAYANFELAAGVGSIEILSDNFSNNYQKVTVITAANHFITLSDLKALLDANPSFTAIYTAVIDEGYLYISAKNAGSQYNLEINSNCINNLQIIDFVASIAREFFRINCEVSVERNGVLTAIFTEETGTITNSTAKFDLSEIIANEIESSFAFPQSAQSPIHPGTPPT
jgi:hypothetical protein